MKREKFFLTTNYMVRDMIKMSSEIEKVIIYFEAKFEEEKSELDGEDKRNYKLMLELLNNARVSELKYESNCESEMREYKYGSGKKKRNHIFCRRLQA